MSWAFAPGHVLLQVLYAIGFGLVAMVPLRRLPDGIVLATGLALVVGAEALAALLLTGGHLGPVIVAYPLLPWLAMMLLGWWFGRFVERSGTERARGLVAL